MNPTSTLRVRRLDRVLASPGRCSRSSLSLDALRARATSSALPSPIRASGGLAVIEELAPRRGAAASSPGDRILEIDGRPYTEAARGQRLAARRRANEYLFEKPRRRAAPLSSLPRAGRVTRTPTDAASTRCC